MKCRTKDPVWDRECTKDVEHVCSPQAKERLHVDDTIPGDRLTWGSVEDMREVERGH